MKWLHLSDLHIGCDNQSQEVAIDSLVASVISESDDKLFDLVLLTGDLAYSGIKEEYDNFTQQILSPLRENKLFKNCKFISVPGNHDMDCSLSTASPWESIGKKRQEKFFYNNDEGAKIRKNKAETFQCYSNFIKEENVTGVDPKCEPANIIKININGEDYLIITIVTSFFSDVEVSDRNKTPAPILPINYLLSKNEHENKRVIILGHHPKSWFLYNTQDQFFTLLNNKKCIYFHGHLHDIRVENGNTSVVSLGFGAAYASPNEDTQPNYYENSYAICEYHDSLHVAITSWDSQYGRWVSREKGLPVQFETKSAILKGGYILPLPSTKLNSPELLHGQSVNIIQVKHKVERSLWLAEKNANKAWLSILNKLDLAMDASNPISFAPETMSPGHVQFRIVSGVGSHLIHAVSAVGDIVNYENVQAVNTKLDTGEYESCLILTLGGVADDAKKLANLLADKKLIKIVDGEEINQALVKQLSFEQKSILNKYEPRNVSIILLILDDNINIVVLDKITQKWFEIYNEDGVVLSEDDVLVAKVRASQPVLKMMQYRVSDKQVFNLDNEAEIAIFDRDEYLKTCYTYFDDVKYAPLSALGFKFENASLSKLYVPANVNYSSAGKNTRPFERSVNEFLESLDIDEGQKEQLERQMKSNYGLGKSAEEGVAQQIYKKFSNVLVLGDPGSGKTCFVKREILGYCKPDTENGAWYAEHTPVYVSMSEAARHIRDTNNILEIISKVSSRISSGVSVPLLSKMISEGHIAFFFDGLDEIGSFEDRIKLVMYIDELISKYSQLGNRFVLTSRPAAIQTVEIPSKLKKIHLQGLTETEMRLLAGRVVSNRLDASSNLELSDENKELVDKLMEDCQKTPGIRRIARNPLLLTLLVLVYANSGALSTRRHIVYGQAIKTLVSVRNRDIKNEILSETDLRSRLGKLAFAIHSNEISEIPTRLEVIHLLINFFDSQFNDQSDSARKYIQQVADETGLLVFHQANDDPDSDMVSFMHYSFLEYYAAVGFLDRDYQNEAPCEIQNSRWNDVITLMFGILSEQHDITNFLSSILRDRSESDKITSKGLLVGFDCALECDVPPEAAQKLIVNKTSSIMENGAARVSLDLRIDIAKRLSQLLQATGSAYIESFLLNGMSNKVACVAAAYIDLVSHLDKSIVIKSRGIEIFEKAFDRSEQVVRCACIEAMQSKPELRTENAIENLRKGLKKGVVERHMSLKTIEVMSGVMDIVWEEVVDLLDDGNPMIANAASRCVLSSGIFASNKMENRQVIDKSLQKLQQGSYTILSAKVNVESNLSYIESLLDSNDISERVTGVRYLLLLVNKEKYVYTKIFHVLQNSDDHYLLSVVLQVLFNADNVLDLLTLKDADNICSLLSHIDKDVRIQSIRVLKLLPSDEHIVTALLEKMNTLLSNKKSNVSELIETFKALAAHSENNDARRSNLLDTVLEYVATKMKPSFGNKNQQAALLKSLKLCERIGGNVEDGMTSFLLKAALDYKTPKDIRRQLLLTFSALTAPNKNNMSSFIAILKSKDKVLQHARYDATHLFVKKLKKSGANVRDLSELIQPMISALCAAWMKEINSVNDRIDHRTLGSLRKSIIDLEQSEVSYKEFSCRMHIEGSKGESMSLDF